MLGYINFQNIFTHILPPGGLDDFITVDVFRIQNSQELAEKKRCGRLPSQEQGAVVATSQSYVDNNNLVRRF